MRRSARARLRYDALLLRLPLLGEIRRKIVMARFAGLFAMMYASGIPIIEALRSTERVVGNRVIQRALERIGQHIAEGQNVSVAFAASNLFPPLVTRMLRVGENTGALDTALANLRYFYDRDVQEATERLQAVVEPMLTLMLAAVLLVITVAADTSLSVAGRAETVQTTKAPASLPTSTRNSCRSPSINSVRARS